MSESSISIGHTGIVIDACCDVPAEFLTQPNVVVIPIPIKIGNSIYIDQHDLQANARYIRENAQGQGAYGQSEPMNAEQMQDFFLEHCALAFDQVYCLTVDAGVSPIYAAASQGLDMALNTIRKFRHEADISRPFICRVVDTRNVFAGEGIAALLLQELLQQPLHPADMFKKFIKGVNSIHTYITADDLGYARNRIKARGDNSLSWLSVFLGQTLNIKPMVHKFHGKSEVVGKFRGRNAVLSQIFSLIKEHVVTQRLNTPHIIISHADALREVYQADTFPQLRTACEVCGVNLHIVPMSITGMMNFGIGSLTVAFAADINQ